MNDKQALFDDGFVLFCTSAILYRLFLKRQERKENSELKEQILRRRRFLSRYSFANMDEMDPSSAVPPKLYSGERPNTISQVDDCHVTTTTNNWTHFECYNSDTDSGHQIKRNLSDGEFKRKNNEESPTDRNFITWDEAMSSEDSYSDSSISSTERNQLTETIKMKTNFFRKHISQKIDRFAQMMPNKLILVRHGQSEGNVSEMIYATKPDNSLALTKLGWEQARMAGRALKESIIGENESIHFVVSPYVRTVETFHGILSAWCDPSEFNHIFDKNERTIAWYNKCYEMGITWSEDPRIREQDFGNYQDPVTIKKAKKERHRFGTFYYRFPYGESASDVFDRVSTFLDSLWRSFDSKRTKNYVIVTHGISIRVFLARYFRYTIDQFNVLSNPKNGELIVLRHDGMGKLKLDGRSELIQEEEKDDATGETSPVLTGYTFHKKLRVLPAQSRVRREVKLSYFD